MVEEDFLNKPAFILYQNYPNPFNVSTIIKYKLEKRQYVSLKVFNIIGEETKTLVNEIQGEGEYEVVFNGEELPSGIYFYRLIAEKSIQTKKLVLMK
jgi:hypothetical protein